MLLVNACWVMRPLQAVTFTTDVVSIAASPGV
jgi:hypothetical protein